MIGGDYVFAFNQAPLAADQLVDERLLQLDFASRDTQHHIATRVEAHLARAGDSQLDGFRVCSRCDKEVIFQFALIAVEHQIYTWIDPFIFHAGIRRHIRVPLLRIIPQEIIHSPRQAARSIH